MNALLLLQRRATFSLNLSSIALRRQNSSENEVSKKCMFHRGVLIERAHYYAIFAEGGRTNRGGVLTEKGALTEGVRYVTDVGRNVNDSNMRVCVRKSNLKWENPPRFLSSSS